MKKRGKVFSINCSTKKGTTKNSVASAELVKNFGLKEDAHAGEGVRQVSLLAIEGIRRQKECLRVKKNQAQLKPGDFAENITTEGLDLSALKIGDCLRIGFAVILEISKIGKECHKYCAIYYRIGDCIMPREGIFAKVISEGTIKKNDSIELL